MKLGWMGGQGVCIPEATSAMTLMAMSSAVMREESRAWVASCWRSNVGLFVFSKLTLETVSSGTAVWEGRGASKQAY